MKTRILALILLSAFSLQAFSLCCALRAQAVAQPSLASTGTLATSGTIAPVPAAAAPSVTPQSAPRTPQSTDDEVVEMSPFVVTSDSDDGYDATRTAAGSRLDTALRDTPASIQVFTQEFLSDVGAQSIEEMLSYGGNVEADFDEGNDFSNSAAREAGALDNRFRIRGMSAGVSLDYTETGVPMDLYNIDRAEISSGPNSILFGIGPQGGILSLQTARANLQRNTTRITGTIRSYVNPFNHPWNYKRFSLGYNVVLIPRRLALRFSAVWQEGSDRSWQYGNFHNTRRLNPAITLRPWKNTRIHAGFESGRTKNSTWSTWNASDMLTAWMDYSEAMYGIDPNVKMIEGRPAFLVTGRPQVNVPGNPGINDFVSPTATYVRPNGTVYSVPIVVPQGRGLNFYSIIVNDGTLFNDRGAWRSNNRIRQGVNNRNRARLDPSISSYNYNTVGPGGRRDQKYERWNLTIDQTIGKLHFDLSYHHNKFSGEAHSPVDNDPWLVADVNPYVSPLEWVDNNTSSMMTNRYAGRLYMESPWRLNTSRTENNSVRGTANYSWNWGKYNLGRHRLIAHLEHAQNEQYSDNKKEILVDRRGYAIQNAANPVGARNNLWRRQYVTEGDFTTYYNGDWRVEFPETTIADRTFHSAYVSTGRARNVHTKRTIDSSMLTLQSFWFKGDQLVTAIGLRNDWLAHRREYTSRVSDPLDPRVISGENVWNEWALSGRWRPTRHIKPYTFSAGATWHVTPRMSVFANFSTNQAAPKPDRQVLPHGDLPNPATGRNIEYGVMFNIHRRINLRLTRYDTRQLGEAMITPESIGAEQSDQLGSENLYNIMDALFFLAPTNYTGESPEPTTDPFEGWFPGTGPVRNPDGTIRGSGPMTLKDYAITQPDPNNKASFPFGAPPLYNAGTVDIIAKGYEARLTANIGRDFTLVFNFSYTQRTRDKIFPEIIKYYNERIPVWLGTGKIDPVTGEPDRGLAGKINPATGKPYQVTLFQENDNGQKIPYTVPLYEYVVRQIYGLSGGGYITAPDGSVLDASIPLTSDQGDLTGLREGLEEQLWRQSGAVGARPFKGNITLRYSFRSWGNRWLKGLTVGGSIRYGGYNLVRSGADRTVDISADNPLGLDPSAFAAARNMRHGNSTNNFSCFFTYRTRLSFLGVNTQARFQLNINNMFNNNLITVGEYNAAGVITRIYQQNPRNIQLTAEFNF